MPKTKDAFAFEKIADELAKFSRVPEDGFDGHGYLPTYTERFDTSEDGRENYLVSLDGLIEDILLGYLMRGETKIKSDEIFSEFEQQHSDLKLCNERIARAKKIVGWFDKHIVRLQKYEKKLFDSILRVGLTADLKSKGNRVKKLIFDYDWLIRLFAGYELILQKDRAKLRSVVNDLYRKEFGNRLRQARVAKKMTVEDVAAKINLTRVGYGYYELGQRDPSPGAIYILAKMFDVSADWLLGLKK